MENIQEAVSVYKYCFSCSFVPNNGSKYWIEIFTCVGVGIVYEEIM